MPDTKVPASGLGGLLSRDAILAADDLPYEDVPVPEWGGVVRVRGLSGKGRDEYLSSMAVMAGGQVVGQNTVNVSARLVAHCVIDPETGDPAFTQADIGKLGEKSAAALGRVFEVAARLSGLSEDDVKSLGEGSAPTLNGAITST